MKRFFSLVLCVAMIATAIFSVSAVSAAEVANGTCGSNLTWTLDSEGTLTISGTGLMYNYSIYDDTDEAGNVIKDNSAPWISYAADIKKVVIGEEVTYIGENAFEGCTALESIVLSAGNYAPYIPVENFELNTPYKLMSYNVNGPIYANTVSGGLKAVSSPVFARDFYIEEATTLDGAPAYRIYYYYNDAKSYLYHEGTSTTGFKYTETVPLYKETTDAETGEVVQGDEISTVWTYEEATGAWLAPASNNRFLAADNTNTREDIRAYAYSNITKAQYTLATLAVMDPTATNIPGITAIGKYAFSDCAALTNIYCRSSEELWAGVTVQNGNDVLATATVTCNYVEEGGATTAPDALTVVEGSTYVVDEAISTIIAKPTSNISLTLSEFKAQIATDAAYINVVNASGVSQTGASVRVTAKLSVQLLDASGAVVKTYKIIVVGDPSGDGRIAAGDVNTINGYVKNSRNYPSGSAEFYAANTNGDKRLSALDVNALKKFMASSEW